MMNKSEKNKILITSILLFLIVLTYTGLTEKILDFFLLNKIEQSNSQYLDQSLNRSLTTFGVLSSIKVGLAVIEGTEIGVGFGVKVGNVVKSISDFVDIAWRTVLLSTTILLGTRLILQTIDCIDHWLIMISLLFFLLTLLSGWLWSYREKFRYILKSITQLIVTVSFCVIVLLPLAIGSGQLLSRKITEPSVSKAEIEITQFKNDYFENIKNENNIWKKLSQTKEYFDQITKYLTGKASEMTLWVLKIIAGYLFDTILFPLSIFILLVLLVKAGTKYASDYTANKILINKIEEIFTKSDKIK